MSWEFVIVAGPLGGTTEGPVWDGESILFTHIPESKIYKYDPESKKAKGTLYLSIMHPISKPTNLETIKNTELQ